MGLFDVFKKNPPHEEKVALAYRCYKPENVHYIFPNGLEQADIIIRSLAEIYKIDLEKLTASEYYQLISAYSDIFIRLNITKVDNEAILKSLLVKHSLFIKNKETAKKVLAYCKLNIEDHSFLVDAKYKLDLLSADLDKHEEFYFETAEEFALYTTLFKRKDVVWLSADEYIKRYKVGYELFEQGKYKTALSAFNDCLRINPVGVNARFEFVECLIALKELILAEGQLRQIRDFLYNNSFKAKFYRRFGYISIEKGLYDRAFACYKYSLNFENHSSVAQELLYIQSKSGSMFKKINNIKEILNKYDVPILEADSNSKKVDTPKKAPPKVINTPNNTSRKSDIEIFKRSSDGEWLCIKKEVTYYFLHKTEIEKKVVKTPAGNLVETLDKELAERILSDLEEYGPEYTESLSILPWYYTYRDNFYTIKQKEIVEILEKSFLEKTDWTFESCYANIFGVKSQRKSDIKTWFDMCYPGQLVAAYCIGNAYHSVNVAYVLATLLENYSGLELKKQFDALADILEEQDYYKEDCIKVFETFELFYKLYEQEKVIIGEKITITKPVSVKSIERKTNEDIMIARDISPIHPPASKAEQTRAEECNRSENYFSSNEEKYGAAWLRIVSEDKDNGMKLMKELDKIGFIEASIVLAMFSEDSNERKLYYKKAAIENNAEGLWGYCSHLPHSFCPDDENSDDRKWLELCTRAANAGSVDAMNELGNVYHRRKQYPESMYWYAMANAHDHPAGEESLNGIAKEWLNAGKPYGYDEKSEYFDEAKYKVAISYLEMWSEQEINIPVDEIITLVLVGEPIAAYFLGDVFEEAENFEMAYKMYNTIAFENDPHGIRCCADMLFRGLGINEDKERAVQLYKKSAELGERTSMFIVGEFTKKENKCLSAYWYGKSHARGYGAALNRLIQLANEV